MYSSNKSEYEIKKLTFNLVVIMSGQNIWRQNIPNQNNVNKTDSEKINLADEIYWTKCTNNYTYTLTRTHARTRACTHAHTHKHTHTH